MQIRKTLRKFRHIASHAAGGLAIGTTIGALTAQDSDSELERERLKLLKEIVPSFLRSYFEGYLSTYENFHVTQSEEPADPHVH